MSTIAARLARDGYTLRSGGADGADKAFENGARYGGGQTEIYIPWSGFNGRSTGIVRNSLGAEALAQSVHPAWERLTPGGRKAHTRNVHQVLGLDLRTPSPVRGLLDPGRVHGSGHAHFEDRRHRDSDPDCRALRGAGVQSSGAGRRGQARPRCSTRPRRSVGTRLRRKSRSPRSSLA